MTCLVLLSLLDLVLVLLLFIFETRVRPRGMFVGGASVASTRRRLLKGLSGLSFCGRVETNLDAFCILGLRGVRRHRRRFG
jgi:hypothetical protein